MKKKVLIGALAFLVIAAAVAIFLFRPVPYHVERSISIDVPPAQAFAAVEDFNQWPQWSPWLHMEPQAVVEITGDGKSVGDVYTWSGDLVGTGEMEHREIQAPESVDMEIRFVEPFASTADVGFRIAPDPANKGRSTATWHMDGKIPSVMRPMMSAWIGMDYDRGLGMLKDYCETGAVPSRTEIVGDVEQPASAYLGIEAESSIDGISESMDQTLADLEARLVATGIQPAGTFLSIYTKWEMVKDRVVYTAAYPVSSKPETVPEGLVYGELPAHKAFKVVHTGPYRHVGNGWSTGMQHLRHGKVKQSRKVMPYEVFAVDSGSIPETELQSAIYFPLR